MATADPEEIHASLPSLSSAAERNKFQSPPPNGASMTPPPSSQAPQLAHSIARTPTPAHSHLSSPPPTQKPSVGAAPPSSSAVDLYTADQIQDAGADDLRRMLTATSASCKEAKASAASLKLQYNLLLMETTETMKRKDVELEMALKEVDVAQTQSRRAASATPTMSQSAQLANAQAHYTTTLKDRVRDLEIENDSMRRRYDDLRSAMRERETTLFEENERLRERIHANRKHLNLLRSSSGTVDGSPISTFSTPLAPARRAGRGGQSVPIKPRDGDAFSQLLLADQVLSQEANTTPSTPTPHGRRGLGHHRGVQSLSSLPSTPVQAQSVPAASRGRNQYYTPRHPRSPPMPQTAPVQRFRQQRRESRDSTISASDIEDEVGEEDLTDREEVNESQASQEARKILTKSSSFGRSPPSSQRSDAATRSSSLLQTKLYGQITRPVGSGNAGKRKASTDASPSKVKKGRTGGGAIGLGIDRWASPSK